MSPGLRVVVAPDSFGGALDSVAAAAAIGRGWASARPDDDIVQIPMADGGEGTLAAIADALGDGVERRSVTTSSRYRDDGSILSSPVDMSFAMPLAIPHRDDERR